MVNAVLIFHADAETVCIRIGGQNQICVDLFGQFKPQSEGLICFRVRVAHGREITVRQVKVDIPKATATVQKQDTRVDNTVQPKTYTVKSGDCLWNIAKKYYGNGADYTKIYNANKGVIGGNPNLIYAGQVLTIP